MFIFDDLLFITSRSIPIHLSIFFSTGYSQTPSFPTSCSPHCVLHTANGSVPHCLCCQEDGPSGTSWSHLHTTCTGTFCWEHWRTHWFPLCPVCLASLGTLSTMSVWMSTMSSPISQHPVDPPYTCPSLPVQAPSLWPFGNLAVCCMICMASHPCRIWFFFLMHLQQVLFDFPHSCFLGYIVLLYCFKGKFDTHLHEKKKNYLTFTIYIFVISALTLCKITHTASGSMAQNFLFH